MVSVSAKKVKKKFHACVPLREKLIMSQSKVHKKHKYFTVMFYTCHHATAAAIFTPASITPASITPATFILQPSYCNLHSCNNHSCNHES
jgi:hypothetical protein